MSIVTETVKNRLKECSLHGQISAEVLPLTFLHKQQRLTFAQEHLHDDFRNWVFSDEVAIETCVNYKKRVWRSYDTRYEQPYVHRVTKSGRRSVKYWGAISFYEEPLLHRVNGNLEQIQYADILEQYAFQVLEDLYLTLIQDGHRSHTTSLIKDLIEDSGRRVLTLPPRSPDLNPIENLWSLLKRNLTDHETAPFTNETLLHQAANKTYLHLANIPNYLNSFYENYGNRLQEVINNQGDYISYM